MAHKVAASLFSSDLRTALYCKSHRQCHSTSARLSCLSSLPSHWGAHHCFKETMSCPPPFILYPVARHGLYPLHVAEPPASRLAHSTAARQERALVWGVEYGSWPVLRPGDRVLATSHVGNTSRRPDRNNPCFNLGLAVASFTYATLVKPMTAFPTPPLSWIVMLSINLRSARLKASEKVDWAITVRELAACPCILI